MRMHGSMRMTGAALLVAIRTNGPAVLNALDRVMGGSRDVALVARTTYGEHPAQKLRIYAPADAAGPLPVFVFVMQDTVQEVLTPGGKFLTFAYLHGLLLPSGTRFKKCLSSRFEKIVETPIIWRNLPPAFVYCAER